MVACLQCNAAEAASLTTKGDREGHERSEGRRVRVGGSRPHLERRPPVQPHSTARLSTRPAQRRQQTWKLPARSWGQLKTSRQADACFGKRGYSSGRWGTRCWLPHSWAASSGNNSCWCQNTSWPAACSSAAAAGCRAAGLHVAELDHQRHVVRGPRVIGQAYIARWVQHASPSAGTVCSAPTRAT